MAKSITAKQKRPGRPATGITPMIGVRATQELRSAIEKWAAKQPDKPSLSEAIRRLVEKALGIGAKPAGGTRESADAGAAKALAMAVQTIDPLIDKAATTEERAIRTRRLLKGPKDFRELRVDRPKKRS